MSNQPFLDELGDILNMTNEPINEDTIKLKLFYMINMFHEQNQKIYKLKKKIFQEEIDIDELIDILDDDSDNESDDNESEDNESDDNESDDNESDDNESNDNESNNNESNDDIITDEENNVIETDEENNVIETDEETT